MRVFNLSSQAVIYKGKTIPPGGGHIDYPSLDFVPDRDRALETKRVLAFETLPAWFVREQALKQAAESAKSSQVVTIALKEGTTAITDEVAVMPLPETSSNVKVEFSDEPAKDKSYSKKR